MFSKKLGAGERPVFEELASLETTGYEQQRAKKIPGGERESHRWYRRERCYTAILRILRYRRKENNLIDDLSSHPEMIQLWRCRFQREATAAVDYVLQ